MPSPVTPAPRRIARTTRAGPLRPGFAGPGHSASEVFGPDDIGRTKPFVMLMDDRLDFRPGQPVGEAHPHAGLETVTLMLEGALNDPVEGLLAEGDMAWMSAGRGVIHNEDVRATGYARILQLWLALPRALRDLDPIFERVPLESVPRRREPGLEARVYHGRSGSVISAMRERVPITVIDFRLEPGVRTSQALPGAFCGFVYVIDGALASGSVDLTTDDVGWLEAVSDGETELALHAGPNGARFILCAGEPVAEPLVQRGPFVAGSVDELTAQYRAYREGSFPRMSQLSPLSGARG